jgi:hypothetical protein
MRSSNGHILMLGLAVYEHVGTALDAGDLHPHRLITRNPQPV